MYIYDNIFKILIPKIIKMSTKEKIEKEFLRAMSSIDEIKYLLNDINEDSISDKECLTSNLIDIKSKLKQYLNKDFDKLARQRSSI
jgi:hypothetical protein